VKLMLATHAVLWFYLGDPQLSATASAIKISTGKYVLAQPYEDFWRGAIDANGFLILPILTRHTALLTTLPYHHRDPFDRLIIVQALVEGMSVVSADAILDAYGVTRVW
jgi:PIN domain nuclease of toxin-antitoxin system